MINKETEKLLISAARKLEDSLDNAATYSLGENKEFIKHVTLAIDSVANALSFAENIKDNSVAKWQPICNFCKHKESEVSFLVKCESLNICNDCIELCNDIIKANTNK